MKFEMEDDFNFNMNVKYQRCKDTHYTFRCVNLDSDGQVQAGNIFKS